MGARPRADRRGAAARARSSSASASRTTRPGRTLDEPRCSAIVDVVERHASARLLVDETYRELAYDAPPLPLAASLSPRAISVSSISKAYGLPGLRIGWLTTTDPALAERLLAAKEQVLLAGSRSTRRWPRACSSAATRSSPACSPPSASAATRSPAGWTGSEHFEWHPPQAGVVCFPRLAPERERRHRHASTRPRCATTAPTSAPATGSSRTAAHFRLGFGWPGMEELLRGLDGLTAAARDAER